MIRLMARLEGCVYVNQAKIEYRFYNGKDVSPVQSQMMHLAKLKLEDCLTGKDAWYFGKISLPAYVYRNIQYRFSVSYQVARSNFFANNSRSILEKQWRYAVAPKEVFDVLDDRNPN